MNKPSYTKLVQAFCDVMDSSSDDDESFATRLGITVDRAKEIKEIYSKFYYDSISKTWELIEFKDE